ncbi:hypothetical protein CXF72_17050 [Psychromonas sp. MB-3u-54]|uniref:hypothetical protein n=1 Tax=Psychromonas sp. MB-3u-54 TaxID=2058319 RepID=UPI000C335254|nr:hypothetical protein [Psychromonas sp. MB-3u-54]PKH01379.1 hypothetical protein CXF72_17050 [Psychromonas sp. MB-3u-54]
MKVNLITNCTNLKKSNIQDKTQLNSLVTKFDSQKIVSSWLKRLNNALQKFPAKQVYAGDHWKIAKSVKNPNVELWVLSAGYGLIHSSSMITAYDATFSKESDNSIHHTGLSNNEWWRLIHQIRDKVQFGCGSLSSLVKDNGADKFFIAASPAYLKVIEEELLELISTGKLTTENLFIVSSKCNLNIKLKPFFLESSANFSSTLKGGRVSLNIRLAKHLLENSNDCNIDKQTVFNRYNSLKNNSQKLVIHQRNKLSDEEVISFIKDELQVNKHVNMSASKLLIKLRSQNLACEQKRFSRLFKETL